MKRISILGVDGSGKTSLLESLAKLADPRLHGATWMHVPQFHLDEIKTSVSPWSEKLENANLRADREGSFETRAISSFLAMSLTGQAEQEMLAANKSHFLIRERDPVLDTVTYSKFYLQTLQPTPQEATLRILGEELGEDDLEEILSKIDADLKSLAHFPFWVRTCFDTDRPTLIQRLVKAYQTEPSDAFFFLKMTPETIEFRLKSKAHRKELHESLNSLVRLQDGLEKIGQEWCKAQAKKWETVMVEGKSAEQLQQLFLNWL